MVSAYHESPWKLMLLVTFLVFFACIGMAHAIIPDWFVKRSGVRKGGAVSYTHLTLPTIYSV